MSEKLLIVEDDKKLNDGIRLALKNDSYFFYQCQTLQEAREILKKEDITLVLLDVNLPDGNGIDFVREIRKNSQVPIILLTVNNMEVDIVTGLEAGANDYITKPFSPSELVARVKAHMSRYARLVSSNAEPNDELEIRGIKIDLTARRVFVNGEEKNFTTKEFDLLVFLAKHPNRVYTKEELFKEIWEMDSVGDIATVTVHIKKIREKIEYNTSKPQYIETIWGVGYRFKI